MYRKSVGKLFQNIKSSEYSLRSSISQKHLAVVFYLLIQKKWHLTNYIRNELNKVPMPTLNKKTTIDAILWKYKLFNKVVQTVQLEIESIK